MDDDSTGRPRNISRRDSQWSMNSQRLEEIVAELMRPISDVRRSFDTDLSALLEEYLTEAGLHALDAAEEGAAPVVPNFAELALLLQQSASIYSRKVDCLYQHVLSVSESLHHSSQEIRAAEGGGAADGGATPAGARRRRKASAALQGFGPIELERCPAARREATLRPPPTLPRMYVELEPRAPSDADAPLCDYAGEPVGMLADFHAAWRLRDGFLAEELRDARPGEPALRPVPLPELSAAIAACAPPSPPPAPRSPTPARSPPPPTPPPPPPTPPPSPPTPPPAPPVAASTPLPDERRRERKRRRDTSPAGRLVLELSDEVRKMQCEFSVPATWLRRVVQARRRAVLDRRRALRAQDDGAEFRGFDAAAEQGGFLGWSSSESAEASTLLRTNSARRPDDSDDDGFFEQSSLGDSDASRADAGSPPAAAAAPEWASWRARVVRRAAAGEARGRDVRAAAAAVLRACERLPPAPPFRALLAAAARERGDVSELFLATLFLANAGNVRLEPAAPRALGAFRVRLRSADPRLYCAALAPADR